jgi:hypothetical protein
VPRTVCQLAQLSLAAAAGDGLDRVDAATVERTWRELSTAGSAGRETEAEDDPSTADAAADQPRVRVVRRLWG